MNLEQQEENLWARLTLNDIQYHYIFAQPVISELSISLLCETQSVVLTFKEQKRKGQCPGLIYCLY